MSVKELEERVLALERQVKQLSNEAAERKPSREKNWLAAVEKYTDDEDVLAVLKDAMKLREKSRRAVHKRRRPTQRKTRS